MNIVAYTGRWCGASTMLRSSFKRENIKFTTIDVEGNLKQADEAGVQGTPTIILTDDSGRSHRLIGYNDDVLIRVQGIIESGVAR